MKRMKIIAFITLLVCLSIAVPASFAVDDDLAIAISDNQDSSISDDVLGSNDYYFNASVENDTGSGSIDNPYKELTTGRIKDNSILHLADGEYDLGFYFSKSANNVTIIGQNVEKTILSYSGKNYPNFRVTNSLTLQNVTLINLVIDDSYNAIVNANNVIFKNSKSSPISADLASTVVSLNSCTFINNTADFGPIFIRDGTLTILDSSFLDNYATFGGAITALNADLIITNITAKNNRAKYDGGAVYAMYGSMSLSESTFNNNSANNGGALYIDDMDLEVFYGNNFTNNKALQTAGAVYSIYNNITISDYNSFSNNSAAQENDVADSLNLMIGNGDYILFYSDPSTFNGTIPSYYSLWDEGYVTPVKNQGGGGNCWAFAAIGSLESCILKAAGISYDFSESNMKNLMAKFSDYGWDMNPNKGGYDRMGYGYLVGWLGPIDESDDIYSGSSLLSPLLNSILHVQNVLFLERKDFSDNDEIKKAILKYGGVATSIRWTGVSVKDNTRYYSGTDGADHAVVIVGWDDNFSKSNFAKTPPGDGAWIVKNSHGTSSGNDGYWYVSYYDSVMAKPGKADNNYVFLFKDTIKYDKNYQYDIAGKTDYLMNYTNTVWYKNVFVSNANEYLAAVSTYFMKETEWELSIYVNGLLRHTQSGYSPNSYSTIELNDFIQLNMGDVFEIVFKTTVDGPSGVPISEAGVLNKEIYHEGISFISYDGNRWTDLYDLNWTYPGHSYNSQVACIKAFTVFDMINTTMELSFNDTTLAVQARILNQYGRPVNVGSVTFSIDGKDYVVKVQNGIAVLNPEVDLGSYDVSAAFNALGHYMSNDSISIEIQSEISTVTSLSVLNEYNSVIVIANVLNQFGYPVNGGSVTFTLDGREIVVDVVGGIAKLIYNFNDLGYYPIAAQFNGIYYFSSSNATSNVTVKSTIISSDATKTYSSSYSVSLLDNYGNPLKNTKVTFVINSKEYYVVTDGNGVANLKISFNPGNYEVKIINPINNESKIQNVTVVKRISENNDLSMYYGAGKYYKVKVLDDNGNVAKGVKVTFTINNVKYTRTTNSYGYASLKIGLNPGKYKVTVEYKGFKASNTVTVKSTLVTKNIVIKKGKTSRFYVKLLNSNGKILKNKKIKIKYRGETYTFKTNYKGMASLKIVKTQKRGTYTIVTSYGKLSVKNKITIK